MDLLFASNSWFNWEAERNFARLKEERPDIAHDAAEGRLGAHEKKGIYNDGKPEASQA